MKKLFCMAGLFFIAALAFKDRHSFANKEFRDKKVMFFNEEFNKADMPPLGQRSTEDSRKINERSLENWRAIQNGERTAGDILYFEWVEKEKKEDTPILYFLFGAGILFTFGGMMKWNSGKTS